MTKQTKQMVTILILCILLIAAGVGYFVLIRHQAAQEQQEETADSEETPLYELSSDDVKQLSFQNDKAELSMVKQKGTWKLADDGEYPLDQDLIVEMVDEMAGATADRVVTENCEDLAEYDLDDPELSIQATDTSGKQTTLVVGMESISGGGRYACCGEDTSKIYIISTSIYTSFDYSLEQMMELPDIPAVKAEKVTHLKIASRKGKGFEAVYDKKNSPYKDIYSWEIDQPYSQPVAGDQDQLQTLFENYAELSFCEGVTYRSEPEKLSRYGLDNPAYEITIETAKKSVRLLVGDKKKDKSGYYVQLAGEDGVYLMDTDTVELLVDITPMNYVYQRLYAGSQEQLRSVELSYKGKNYSFAVTKKKADSDSDSTEEEYTYTIKQNGKKVDADAFAGAFEAVSNLAPNGEIDSAVEPSGDGKVAEFIFHEKKKDVTLTVYPYDNKNFYRIKVDDVMQFVVDIRTVDSIVDSFVSLE